MSAEVEVTEVGAATPEPDENADLRLQPHDAAGCGGAEDGAAADEPQPALTAWSTLHTLLCRREAGAFQRAAKATGETGEALLVACTQERRLFLELNEQTEGAAHRSTCGRSASSTSARPAAGRAMRKSATPKIAALIAAAQLPAPQPVANVSYRSGGRCLVIGDADAAEQAAALLDRQARRQRCWSTARAARCRKPTSAPCTPAG